MTVDRPFCEQVASWALGALPDNERPEFEAHLAGCEDCRRELTQMQVVTDVLAASAPPARSPAELRGRLMAVVEAEAGLLAAAGPEADRVVPHRRRRWLPGIPIRPLAAGLAALALVAAGVGGWALRDRRADRPLQARTVPVQVSPLLGGGPTASVALLANRTTLRMSRFPAPARGRVYQVWLQPRAGEAPTATSLLFTVGRDGSASVELPAGARRVSRVLVTSEPEGGSTTGFPSSRPVLTASL